MDQNKQAASVGEDRMDRLQFLITAGLRSRQAFLHGLDWPQHDLDWKLAEGGASPSREFDRMHLDS